MLPVSLSAHAAGGSLEKQVGEYLIDIGYDTVEIIAGRTVTFDALLIKDPNSIRWSYAPYDHVWVKIQPPRGEPHLKLFSVPDPSAVTFPYTFEKKGTYRLAIRFVSGDDVLAEHAFDIAVESDTVWTSARIGAAIGFTLLILLFLGAGYFVLRSGRAR